eukprot:TRINITY_DN30396_c0_g1_i1.p1 TRINITY_DN30396_c0_g1~~TRINITY_DN30396_c0_g1_i1.p1  ORF type:complete len:560 (+),score=190.94 TRINITY_DN30396_c0_g1_i1:66-1682(+)
MRRFATRLAAAAARPAAVPVLPRSTGLVPRCWGGGGGGGGRATAAAGVAAVGAFWWHAPAAAAEEPRDCPDEDDAKHVSGNLADDEQLSVLARVCLLLRCTVRAVVLLCGAVPLMLGALLYWCSGGRLLGRERLHQLILSTFVRGGPCFVKLGQWIATRPDVFPDDLCLVVQQLHENCPPHKWADTEARLRSAFGQDYESAFDSIEKDALHSGCVAQVHRAVLRSGQEVVLKVLHPGIEQTVDTDLRLMSFGAWALEKLPGVRWMAVRLSAAEFDRMMRLQLDLTAEAEHLRRFTANFESIDGVRFPSPVAHLCTKAVIAESFERGQSVNRYRGDDVDPAVKKHLAYAGTRSFFKMLFDDNFVHADMHPGNILVRMEGAKPVLVYLDCGLVFGLTKKDRRNFIELFGAICAGDGKLVADLMRAGARYQNCKDVGRLESEMQSIVDRVNHSMRRSLTLRDLRMGDTMRDVMACVRRHEILIEPNYASLLVSVAVLEGLGRALHPELDLFRVAAPYLLPHLEKTDLKRLAPVIRQQFLGF